MKKIIFKITTVIRVNDEITQEDIEDDLIEALENIGSRFIAWTTEIEEEDTTRE